MRHNLYMFRCGKRLTQDEMAKLLGVSRVTYSYVERGERSGTFEFWSNLQRVFNVPDSDMYPLQKLEEGKDGECGTSAKLQLS